MVAGGSAIRGSRVGAGPMGEQDRGIQAERVQIHYWCANGHEASPYFLATVLAEEIPETIDCPSCGIPAGRNQDAPPDTSRQEPYKTHLAYVKERRTPEEAEALLEEALANLRERRSRAMAEMEKDREAAQSR